ncbi:MAG: DegT/DnrJ/EryC1/StrS family aminotransferase [Deltaproteobacteria bacterium]|nr:DegT/DnrJ/EryC1/StrS family aminotransferase [Deltaproteobacteria bacterium]MBW2063921.1 DegT/DnrJ/EryC1/StrS family aminotransferase [Deltaproteobacteria bacterium]
MNKDKQLALMGGRPLNSKPFPEYNTIGREEREAVLRVLESGRLSDFVATPGDLFWGGKRVRLLEEAFAEYFEVPYAIAVNSATSGLYCALMAMGIGPGDEVIVPPYTMSATATTVLMTGAIPIFADIEPHTFGLDPSSVKNALSPYTRGIVAVNLFGHPAQLHELKQIAEEKDLFLLEDNAQAPGAVYKGKYTGTIGDAGVFSFNRHKTIQCGEGGVVITRSAEIARKCALVRNHGECIVGEWDQRDIVNSIGGNYRMTELEAAVAYCQFRKLEALNSRRIELADYLTQRIKNIGGILPPKVEESCKHVYYFYVMRYDEEKIGIPRDLFVEAVNAEGVYLRAGYLEPLYMLPLFQRKICFGGSGYPFRLNPRKSQVKYTRGLCPVVEKLQDKEIILTNITYPPLKEREMEVFLGAVEKVFEKKKDLLLWDCQRQKR